MNPPIVYEETRPSSQKTIRMTAMVSSMILLLGRWRRSGSDAERPIATAGGAIETGVQGIASLTLSVIFSTVCLV